MLAAALLFAAAVDPSLFRDVHWRLIGPFRGGRVLAVTGVPSEPEHFYFGSCTTSMRDKALIVVVTATR